MSNRNLPRGGVAAACAALTILASCGGGGGSGGGGGVAFPIPGAPAPAPSPAPSPAPAPAPTPAPAPAPAVKPATLTSPEADSKLGATAVSFNWLPTGADEYQITIEQAGASAPLHDSKTTGASVSVTGLRSMAARSPCACAPA